ncbi:hypothetical protein [Serratia fonticola]
MSKGSKFRSGTDLPTVAENIQTLTGQRGNGLDRAVTARELAELGLASKRVGAGGQVSLIPGVTPPPGWGGPGANKPVQYPTRPTGFTAYGAFSFIALVWDMPKYGGHTLTEVYRNSEDNLANAVLVGTEAAGVYSDPQNTGMPGSYYWIRHVNANGLPGPFNDSKGTFAQTDPNAAQNLVADRVVAGIEIITPLIRSARIENGRFTVDENGNVVATNASMNFMTANGGWFYDVYAERITVNNASINNAVIAEDCTILGTLYARQIVGDITKTYVLENQAPEVTISAQDFDRILVSHPVVVVASNENSRSVYFTLNGSIVLTIETSAGAGATHVAQDALFIIVPAFQTVKVGFRGDGGAGKAGSSGDYPSRVIINVFKK